MLPTAILAVLAMSSAVAPVLAQQVGSDGPADPATKGYFFFQTALHVRDMAASRRFYGDLLGLRHIFTYATPAGDYSLTLLGHAQGGRNQSGFQTGPELVSETTNLAGLIELHYSRDWAEKHANRTIPSSEAGLSHIGLVVPDVELAQERMQQQEIPFLKRLGEAPTAASTALATAFGVDGNATLAESAFLGLRKLGFDRAFHVADPDGNVVEVAQAM